MIFSALSALGYVIAGVLAAAQIKRQSPLRWRMLRVTVALSLGLHLASFLTGTTGLDLRFFHAVSLFAFSAMLTTLAVSWRINTTPYFAVIAPFAAIAVALHLFAPEAGTVTPLSWQLRLHALLAVIATSILVLASVHAIWMLVSERYFRRHKPMALSHILPPLVEMDVWLLRMLQIGLFMLTLVLLTGVLFVENLLAQSLAHKTVLSALAWLVFAVLLIGHYVRGWRGKTAAKWTLSGMSLLILAYFGSKAVLELILMRG